MGSAVSITMKLYWVYVVLFLVSLLLFFGGAFIGNPAVVLTGALLGVVLFLGRRFFLRGM